MATAAILSGSFDDLAGATPARPPRPARHLWPLMSDVASARAEVPELLIQWRRARGEADPRPAFSLVFGSDRSPGQ